MLTKKATKVLGLILSVIMALSVMAGCGEQKGTNETQATEAATVATTAEGNGPTEAALEPYEFTMYFNYDWWDVSKKWGADKISAVLKEKFNITVNQAKPEGDATQKLNVMVASDDLPDAIMLERDPNYKKLIQLGSLVPLDDYIAGYPGYQSVVDPATINLSRVDGKVYGMLNWATSDKHPTGNGGWVLNKKIYQELGSPAIKTTDDLYNYLKLIKEKNVTVDGKPIIPLQFGSYPTLIYAQMMTGSYGIVPMEGVAAINNELKLYYTHPKFEECMLFMNKLWNENLLNKDYFVEKSEQIEEKLINGRFAVYAGSDITSNLNKLRPKLLEKDEANDFIVVEPVTGGGVELKDVYNATYSTLGWNVLCITKKAKQPERIFQLADYTLSNEGALLGIFGPKGEMYDELDENGYPILKKTESQLTDDERNALGIWNWTLLGNTLFTDFSKVAADNRKPEAERDWTIQAQANIIWKHSMNADAFINTTLDPQSPEGIIYTSFDDLNKKMLPKIIMAKSEELCRQAIKEAIDNAYKLGFDKVEKLKTEIYKANTELIGSK